MGLRKIRRKKNCHKNNECVHKSRYSVRYFLKWLYSIITTKVCWWIGYNLDTILHKRFQIEVWLILIYFLTRWLKIFTLKIKISENNDSYAKVIIFKNFLGNLNFFATKIRNKNFCILADIQTLSAQYIKIWSLKTEYLVCYNQLKTPKK